MGVLSKLNKHRNVEQVAPAVAASARFTDNLFHAVYGKPDPSKLRNERDGIRVLTGAEAEAHLARPLTPAQQEGVRAQARVAGVEQHAGDATATAADAALDRAARLLERTRHG